MSSIKNKNHKIFLIAGSTGGHALPILELTQKLSANGYRVLVFISGSIIEKTIFNRFNTVQILSGRLSRHQRIKNIAGTLLTGLGFVQVLVYMLFNRPKLIVAKGSFLAVPILYAAKILNIPFFCHESDSIIGLANKIFLKSAKKFFVGFPKNTYSEKLPAHVEYAGQIIRQDLIDQDRSESNTTMPTIFVTGGSQGARAINQMIFAMLPALLRKFRVVHQIGENDQDMAKKVLESIDSSLKPNYHYFSFSIEENRRTLLEADLIISRAGANTLGEIAALSRASILIPYPYASADHQVKNARYFEKLGGAIMIKEDNLTEKSLLDRIDFLMRDPKNLEVIGKNAAKAIKFDGLKVIYSAVELFFKE